MDLLKVVLPFLSRAHNLVVVSDLVMPRPLSDPPFSKYLEGDMRSTMCLANVPDMPLLRDHTFYDNRYINLEQKDEHNRWWH